MMFLLLRRIIILNNTWDLSVVIHIYNRIANLLICKLFGWWWSISTLSLNFPLIGLWQLRRASNSSILSMPSSLILLLLHKHLLFNLMFLELLCRRQIEIVDDISYISHTISCLRLLNLLIILLCFIFFAHHFPLLEIIGGLSLISFVWAPLLVLLVLLTSLALVVNSVIDNLLIIIIFLWCNIFWC